MIGLLALVTVARTPDDIYGAFIAVPLGSLGFALLAARELDQSFANVYSTAVSLQNMRPLWDRRVLAVVISVLATALALWTNINDYENFLVLLGSVFIPMTAVFLVDYFIGSRGRWDLGVRSAERWAMIVPWALGFVVYQMINPGYIGWWVSMWSAIVRGLHFHAQPWMSASIASFVVAGAATVVGDAALRVLRRPRRER